MREEKLFKEGDQLFRVTQIPKSDGYYVELVTIIKTTYYYDNKTSGHWVYRDNRSHSYFNRNISSSCFRTKEEAEKEIQRRNNIREKRNMLKQYERELNEKLGLTNHFVIK